MATDSTLELVVFAVSPSDPTGIPAIHLNTQPYRYFEDCNHVLDEVAHTQAMLHFSDHVRESILSLALGHLRSTADPFSVTFLRTELEWRVRLVPLDLDDLARLQEEQQQQQQQQQQQASTMPSAIARAEYEALGLGFSSSSHSSSECDDESSADDRAS